MDASGCNDAKDYVGGCPLEGPHCGRAVSQQSFDDADDLSVCGGSRRGHFFFLGGLLLLGWCSIPVTVAEAMARKHQSPLHWCISGGGVHHQSRLPLWGQFQRL